MLTYGRYSASKPRGGNALLTKQTVLPSRMGMSYRLTLRMKMRCSAGSEELQMRPLPSLFNTVRLAVYFNETIQLTRADIPYVNDEQASAATKNGHLKLMFSLVSLEVEDEGMC